VNDRGPADPGRVIALTPARPNCCKSGGWGTQVRIVLLPAETQQLAAQLHGGTLHVALNTDPVGMSQRAISPPARCGAIRSLPRTPQSISPAASDAAPAAPVPDRLPENVTLTTPQPGQLYVRVDDFARAEYAFREAAILSPYGAVIRQSRHGGERFFVRGGPYPTVAAADAALNLALRLGLKGARITVE